MENWNNMTRYQQIEWYEKHTWIPIPEPDEGYKVSITTRYIMWMLVLGYLCKYKGGHRHYEEVNNYVREIYNKPKFLLSSYGRLVHEPFGLIEPEINHTKKTNKSGYFKLSGKGIQFINGKIRVPKSVLFFKNGTYKILDDNYIYINEVPKLNFQEALHKLKTY